MVQKILSRLFSLGENRNCSECGRYMSRVHRFRSDRLLSLFVPVVRCTCCGRTMLVRVEEGKVGFEEAIRRRP